MKIHIWTIGKTNDEQLKASLDEFTKRIGNYFSLQWTVIPPPKNVGSLSTAELKKKEAEIILARLNVSDFLVALDENGKQFSSEALALFVQKRANESVKKLIFLISGAFGLDATILKRANYCWSLSQLTFPHQLVRLILAEQIYRACTILRNEKYHHK